MKGTLNRFVCYGLLITLGASCQISNTSRPVPTETPEISSNWWTTWLAHPVCKPPCWQNITPGLTTMEEAVSILENSPEIKIKFQDKYGIDWRFNQNKDEGGVITTTPDGIVYTIRIGSVSERKLFVKTIVASYGHPEYVKPYDCREGMCATILVYPDVGIFLDVFIKNTGTISIPQIEIRPDTPVYRVYFFEQGIENFQRIPTFQNYELLMEWKGYGEYP